MRFAVPAMVALLLGASLGGAMLLAPEGPRQDDDRPSQSPPVAPAPTNSSFELVTSGTEAEFRSYVERANRRADRGGTRWLSGGPAVAGEGDGGRQATAVPEEADGEMQPTRSGGDSGDGGDGARYGETNVQETGVDEPDVLKTVDDRFYYSLPDRHRHAHDDDGRVHVDGRTVAVDASEPGTARVTAEIDRAGRMLVAEDRVVVVNDQAVAGYDVSDPDDPELVWERNVSGRVTSARLYDGRLYLVVAEQMGTDDCRGEPVEGTDVHCTEVYHPDRPVPVDVTYTALAMAPTDGTVADQLSFVGGRSATVYMSTEGLYVTYLERTPEVENRLEFLLTDGRDLLDDEAVAHLEEVREYDLAPRAKREEVRATIQRWLNRQSEEDRRDLMEELEEGYREYLRERKRGLDRTHVVRLSLEDGISEAATGTVPGQVLNQFSFDVHDGHLRVATTVGERRPVESANDVYVLDTSDLSVEGSVTGMSPGQRVYGVRFVGEKGYVITFRQVDPLHVLDLSDPQNPEETGELKLPGFSRYLHPLDDGRILGIGEEDGKVKAVIFDVSDPTDPRIEESRILDARYSAIEQTHHAFMRDERHGVFFLPTERGGYVLDDGDLSTVRRVEVDRPQRARYAGDHLYVFGNSEVVVLDERDWTRTTTVDLQSD
jgi:uncharacterized secreted protein with C-terminal beta-propeller domain